MSLEKNLSQLKKLNHLQPNQDWESAAKYDLLSEIHSQNRLRKAQQLTTVERFDLLMMKATRRLMPSVTKVIAGFLIVFLGTGTGFAAQASVPGQPLWPIKRSMERAELTLAFNPVKETEVHIKHINKRLTEIDKIVESTKTEAEPEKVAKQEKAIKQAVSHLEKDVTAADTSLKIVKEEKQPLEIVELAQKVTKVTQEAVVSLGEQAVDSQDQAVEDALNDVKDINEEVKEAAVSLALEVHEAIEKVAEADAAPEVTEEQQIEIIAEADAVAVVVAEMIAEEISQLSDDIDDAQGKVDVINQVELDAAIDVAETVPADQEPILDRVTEVQEQPQEAGLILDEAKVLLEEGSLQDALDKVSESKEVNEKAEVVLEILDNAAEQTESDDELTPDQPVEDNTQATEVEPEESIEAAAIEPEEGAEESDIEEAN
jgi:hypothetical protein